MTTQPLTILHVDDDPDDRLLVRDAMEESGCPGEIEFVENGEEMLDCLHRRGKFKALQNKPLPAMILLDLNMPLKDGREALREIKADPELRGIPVIVLTTSKAKDDIVRVYALGGSSFIIKPSSFKALVAVMATLHQYWINTVKLPITPRGGSHASTGQSVID